MGHLISHPCFPTFQSPPLKLTISALRLCSHSELAPRARQEYNRNLYCYPDPFSERQVCFARLSGGIGDRRYAGRALA